MFNVSSFKIQKPSFLTETLPQIKDHLKSTFSQPLLASLNTIKRKTQQFQDEQPTIFLQVGSNVWEGVPRGMRTELWLSVLQRKDSTIGADAMDKYSEMLSGDVKPITATDIDKDVPRTFPNTKKFHSQDGQSALRRVLRAYAAYDPEVGYCQGMNFLAGLLLLYLSEEQAFGALVLIMHERGYRALYQQNMSLLQVQLWQLNQLMPHKLRSHMESCGVVPVLFAAPWLMTCYSVDFPISFSSRVLDMVLSNNMTVPLLRVALIVLKKCERKLRTLPDMEDILMFLKLEVPGWDEVELHDILTDAFNRDWSDRQKAVLSTTDGIETIAQAMERVHASPEEQCAAGSPPVGMRMTTATTDSELPSADAALAIAAAEGLMDLPLLHIRVPVQAEEFAAAGVRFQGDVHKAMSPGSATNSCFSFSDIECVSNRSGQSPHAQSEHSPTSVHSPQSDFWDPYVTDLRMFTMGESVEMRNLSFSVGGRGPSRGLLRSRSASAHCSMEGYVGSGDEDGYDDDDDATFYKVASCSGSLTSARSTFAGRTSSLLVEVPFPMSPRSVGSTPRQRTRAPESSRLGLSSAGDEYFSSNQRNRSARGSRGGDETDAPDAPPADGEAGLLRGASSRELDGSVASCTSMPASAACSFNQRTSASMLISDLDRAKFSSQGFLAMCMAAGSGVAEAIAASRATNMSVSSSQCDSEEASVHTAREASLLSDEGSHPSQEDLHLDVHTDELYASCSGSMPSLTGAGSLVTSSTATCAGVSFVDPARSSSQGLWQSASACSADLLDQLLSANPGPISPPLSSPQHSMLHDGYLSQGVPQEGDDADVQQGRQFGSQLSRLARVTTYDQVAESAAATETQLTGNHATGNTSVLAATDIASNGVAAVDLADEQPFSAATDTCAVSVDTAAVCPSEPAAPASISTAAAEVVKEPSPVLLPTKCAEDFSDLDIGLTKTTPPKHVPMRQSASLYCASQLPAGSGTAAATPSISTAAGGAGSPSSPGLTVGTGVVAPCSHPCPAPVAVEAAWAAASTNAPSTPPVQDRSAPIGSPAQPGMLSSQHSASPGTTASPLAATVMTDAPQPDIPAPAPAPTQHSTGPALRSVLSHTPNGIPSSVLQCEPGLATRGSLSAGSAPTAPVPIPGGGATDGELSASITVGSAPTPLTLPPPTRNASFSSLAAASSLGRQIRISASQLDVAASLHDHVCDTTAATTTTASSHTNAPLHQAPATPAAVRTQPALPGATTCAAGSAAPPPLPTIGLAGGSQLLPSQGSQSMLHSALSAAARRTSFTPGVSRTSFTASALDDASMDGFARLAAERLASFNEASLQATSQAPSMLATRNNSLNAGGSFSAPGSPKRLTATNLRMPGTWEQGSSPTPPAVVTSSMSACADAGRVFSAPVTGTTTPVHGSVPSGGFTTTTPTASGISTPVPSGLTSPRPMVSQAATTSAPIPMNPAGSSGWTSPQPGGNTVGAASPVAATAASGSGMYGRQVSSRRSSLEYGYSGSRLSTQVSAGSAPAATAAFESLVSAALLSAVNAPSPSALRRMSSSAVGISGVATATGGTPGANTPARQLSSSAWQLSSTAQQISSIARQLSSSPRQLSGSPRQLSGSLQALQEPVGAAVAATSQPSMSPAIAQQLWVGSEPVGSSSTLSNMQAGTSDQFASTSSPMHPTTAAGSPASPMQHAHQPMAHASPSSLSSASGQSAALLNTVPFSSVLDTDEWMPLVSSPVATPDRPVEPHAPSGPAAPAATCATAHSPMSPPRFAAPILPSPVTPSSPQPSSTLPCSGISPRPGLGAHSASSQSHESVRPSPSSHPSPFMAPHAAMPVSGLATSTSDQPGSYTGASPAGEIADPLSTYASGDDTVSSLGFSLSHDHKEELPDTSASSDPLGATNVAPAGAQWQQQQQRSSPAESLQGVATFSQGAGVHDSSASCLNKLGQWNQHHALSVNISSSPVHDTVFAMSPSNPHGSPQQAPAGSTPPDSSSALTGGYSGCSNMAYSCGYSSSSGNGTHSGGYNSSVNGYGGNNGFPGSSGAYPGSSSGGGNMAYSSSSGHGTAPHNRSRGYVMPQCPSPAPASSAGVIPGSTPPMNGRWFGAGLPPMPDPLESPDRDFAASSFQSVDSFILVSPPAAGSMRTMGSRPLVGSGSGSSPPRERQLSGGAAMFAALHARHKPQKSLDSQILDQLNGFQTNTGQAAAPGGPRQGQGSKTVGPAQPQVIQMWQVAPAAPPTGTTENVDALNDRLNVYLSDISEGVL